MASAIDYINAFTADLENNQDKWKTYVINPFTDAYIDAFGKFNETLKAQKEADKAHGLLLSLSMLALSLCGGGLLTATFGATALKTIVGNAAQKLANNSALDFMVRHNMERAFRAADYLANNKTGNFIAGKLWDELEAKAGSFIGGKVTKAKEAIHVSRAAYPSVEKFVREPMKIYLALDTFVGEAKIKCHDLAAGYRDDDKLTDDEKIKKVAGLRKSTVYNPPQRSIAHAKLQDEIELSFYLYMVMESDYLWTDYREDWTDSGGRSMRRTGTYSPTKKTPINEPMGSANYPKSTPGRPSPNSQMVWYEKMGGVITDRLNELHSGLYGNKFMSSRQNSEYTVAAAQSSINTLANGNIKRLIGNTSL
jgi:hypothetical protein